MRRIFLTACLVILASGAHAEDCDRSDDSQQMMNICASEDFSAADAKLNETYQNLIGGSDANTGKLLQSRATRLDRLFATRSANTPPRAAKTVPSIRWRFRSA